MSETGAKPSPNQLSKQTCSIYLVHFDLQLLEHGEPHSGSRVPGYHNLSRFLKGNNSNK